MSRMFITADSKIEGHVNRPINISNVDSFHCEGTAYINFCFHGVIVYWQFKDKNLRDEVFDSLFATYVFSYVPEQEDDGLIYNGRVTGFGKI